MRLWHWLNAVQQGQRGYLMPWSPVCFGLGVAVYFALPMEPGRVVYGAALAVAALALILGRVRREVLGPLATGILPVAQRHQPDPRHPRHFPATAVQQTRPPLPG